MAQLRRNLLEGSYRLGLLTRTILRDGEEVYLFSARDDFSDENFEDTVGIRPPKLAA